MPIYFGIWFSYRSSVRVALHRTMNTPEPNRKSFLSQNTNPLSAVEPWNLVADGYAETTMLVFEQFAEKQRGLARAWHRRERSATIRTGRKA